MAAQPDHDSCSGWQSQPGRMQCTSHTRTPPWQQQQGVHRLERQAAGNSSHTIWPCMPEALQLCLLHCQAGNKGSMRPASQHAADCPEGARGGYPSRCMCTALGAVERIRQHAGAPQHRCMLRRAALALLAPGQPWGAAGWVRPSPPPQPLAGQAACDSCNTINTGQTQLIQAYLQ